MEFPKVACLELQINAKFTIYFDFKAGLEYRYSNIDIIEIIEIFLMIFWISNYRNSSKANFDIISIYRNFEMLNSNKYRYIEIK